MLKRAAKSMLNSIGLEVVRHKDVTVSGYKYKTVIPNASYSPWLTNEDFSSAYARIKKNTLVDIYRCFELWNLVRQAVVLPGNILEVGVWRGGTGAIITASAEKYSIGKKVFLADTFSGVVKASEKDASYAGGEHSDTSAKIVKDLIKSFDFKKTAVDIKVGIFPDSFADEMDEQRFCFVHIDVDVYQSAKDILEYALPRLSAGGIIVFDDYGFSTCDGIAKLVDENIGRPGLTVLHNLNGHAILIKRE